MVLDRFRKAAVHRNEKTLEQPVSPLRHDERILLNALLSDGEWREGIIGEMKPMETMESLPSRRILRAVFALHEAGGRIGFEEINARLEEADQNLLAQAVFHEDGEITQDEIAAAIGSIRRSEDQLRRGQLKARIRAFEREGKLEEAIRLTMELQGLERAGRRGPF